MAQIPLDKLENILIRSAELEKSLSSELSSDEYVKLSKEYSELEPLKKAINDWKNFLSETDELNEIISDTSSDEEMVNLAKNEFEELKEKIICVEESIQLMLLPKDKADSNDVILEIRAVREVMKLQFLREICIECIKDIVILINGKHK